MKENLNNIRLVCDECASRPQEKYALMNSSEFLNKWVKVCFEENLTGRKEHLWIKVLSVKDDKTLIGIVDNDSFLNLNIKCGDSVEVQLHEIEDIVC